jgi:hypothetical protein
MHTWSAAVLDSCTRGGTSGTCRTWGAARRIAACGYDKYRRPGRDLVSRGRTHQRGLTCAAIAPLSFLRLAPDGTAEGLASELVW